MPEEEEVTYYNCGYLSIVELSYATAGERAVEHLVGNNYYIMQMEKNIYNNIRTPNSLSGRIISIYRTDAA